MTKNNYKELRNEILRLENENDLLKKKLDIAAELNRDMFEKLTVTIERNTQLERFMRKA